MIAQLLADSRTAHARYRSNKARMASQGGQLVKIDGNPVAAGEALHEALRLRTEAEALDPRHADLAWHIDAVGHPHDALVEFYISELVGDVLSALAHREPAQHFDSKGKAL